MFSRPRCREWTPLATQQLRLRSLIQIVGYNIRPPERCCFPCSFYLTLHHTTMSAPFYTSERVCSPHPKWKEIDSEITQRMSSTNVVIRIWCHIIQEEGSPPQDVVIQTWGVYLSGLRYIGANLASNFNSDCFKSNTLVFQMLGGYFCSYKSLKLDIIPPENENEHGSQSSDSSGRTNLSKITLDSRMILNNKLKESRSVSPSKHSRKDDKEYSKSHSPKERYFHQNFPALRNSSSLNISRRNEESNYTNIYEHSPENLDVKEFNANDLSCLYDSPSKNASQENISNRIDLSETAENYDLRNEADGMPKYRYLALSFLKSEIRPSYNATKLQKLHLLQYSIKKRQEAVQEIKERIYKISALSDRYTEVDDDVKKCKNRQRNLFSSDDLEGFSSKSSSQSDLSGCSRMKDDKPVSNGPRLALKLNDLLSFKAKPSPFQRAEHVRLTKQLEILRFKRIILADERDSKLANIRRLKERRAKLAEENQDVGTELMQNYHALSRRSEAMKETRQSWSALRELAARSHGALATRRYELLHQLHDVFYIQQTDPITWTICGIPLPICGDDHSRSQAMCSAGAGLAAQAACLAALVLNQPLRYCITLRGDTSTILDVTPDLPDPNIPLYARGGDVTLFRYAMFLLNKCIGQLCYGRGLPIADIRPTLYNLQRLLTSHSNLPAVYDFHQLQASYKYLSDATKLYGLRWLADNHGPSWTQSLRSLVASERGKYRPFNRFKDAVDGQSPHSAMIKRHRHSRSVGSYQDDQELPRLDASTTSIMGSESNIYNMKLTQAEPELPSNLKKQISDSDILRLTEESQENKVMFTLGDDSTLESFESKLVRISSNNDDEVTCASCLDDNVKRICTEITDFCSKDSIDTECDKWCAKEIHEGFDVAKYMASKAESVRANETGDTSRCDNDESERDGECDVDCAKNLTDVTVIEKEAILSTVRTQDGGDVLKSFADDV